MFKISIIKLESGRWLAYLTEDESDEYFEIGTTRMEAFGKLVELLIENGQIEEIEIINHDEADQKSDIEIMRKLNNRGIL